MPGPEGFIESVYKNSQAYRDNLSPLYAPNKGQDLENPSEFQLELQSKEGKARQDHLDRFEPLQCVLDVVGQDLVSFRDRFIPDSPVFLVDKYEYPFRIPGRRRVNNTYYRAMMVLDSEHDSDSSQELLAIYVVAQEKTTERLFKRPIHQTEISIGTGIHRVNTDQSEINGYDPLREFYKKVKDIKGDFTQLSPDHDLFQVEPEGEGLITNFGNYLSLAPTLNWQMHDIGTLYPYKTFRETGEFDNRLENILTSSRAFIAYSQRAL